MFSRKGYIFLPKVALTLLLILGIDIFYDILKKNQLYLVKSSDMFEYGLFFGSFFLLIIGFLCIKVEVVEKNN